MSAYQPSVSLFWWVRRRSYFLFAVRELSSLAVAWFVVYLLLFGHAVASGEGSYREFVELSGRPWLLTVNLVALLFALVHAVTWLNLAPKAMVVRIRGRRVQPLLVAVAHYGAWIVVSALVAWLVLA